MRRTIMLAAVAAASVTGASEEYDLPDGVIRTSGNSESPAPTTGGLASRMYHGVKHKLFGTKDKPDHEQETDTQGETTKPSESETSRSPENEGHAKTEEEGNTANVGGDDPSKGDLDPSKDVAEKDLTSGHVHNPSHKLDPPTSTTSADKSETHDVGTSERDGSGDNGEHGTGATTAAHSDKTILTDHHGHLKDMHHEGKSIWDSIHNVPTNCVTNGPGNFFHCGGEDQLLNDDQCGLASVLGTCGLAYLLSFFCRGKGKKSVQKKADDAQSTDGGSDGGEVVEPEVPEIDDVEEIVARADVKASGQSSGQSDSGETKGDRKSGAFVKICASIAVLGLVAGTVYYFFFTGESEEDEEEDEEEQSSEGDE